jgi:hypothetical protein
MGCCGGDREKGLTVAEDQKWTYIVRTIATATYNTLTVTEPLRFQVQLLPHALLLRLAVDSRHHLLRSLLRRRLYRRQSARLQQMVEPSEAKGAL